MHRVTCLVPHVSCQVDDVKMIVATTLCFQVGDAEGHIILFIDELHIVLGAHHMSPTF